MKKLLFLMAACLLAEEPKPSLTVSPAVKLSLKQHQGNVQEAMILMLQSEEYQTFTQSVPYKTLQALQKQYREAVTLAQKEVGCDINLQTLDCVPKVAASAK